MKSMEKINFLLHQIDSKLEEKEKSVIIEFILRWQYEKTFQHSDNY